MDDQQFFELVERAVASLPREFAEHLWNLEVVVEREPSRREMADLGMGPEETLLGLYHGVPLPERGGELSGGVPDVISIYRGPIERECDGDPECIRREVEETVRHEVAHYFGISDERLIELGRD